MPTDAQPDPRTEIKTLFAVLRKTEARATATEIALYKMKKALSEAWFRCTNYDWNADPDSITLLQGDAFQSFDAYEMIAGISEPPSYALVPLEDERVLFEAVVGC